MPDFSHVTDLQTVAVLTGQTATPAAVERALDYASACLIEDEDRDDIAPVAIEARAAALDYALTAWNIPDLPGAVMGLQRFWSV